MDLVNHVCRKKKAKYDRCVSRWYNREFVVGKSMDQEEACGAKFEAYRECVLKGIRRELWDDDKWGPPKDGSPLAEVIDDHDDDEGRKQFVTERNGQ